MADDTKTYESEAEATRDRIAATMDDLQARLSPRNIMNDAVDRMTERSSNAIDSVKTLVGSHPVALAAAGLAIGISLLARSKIQGASIEYGDSYAAYSDYDDGYAANLSDGEGDVGGVGARIEALNDRAYDAVDDNPLSVLLVGVATGALLGAIIPVSDMENRVFGTMRDRLGAAGRAAVDAARDQLDTANFTLTNGVSGLADQASNAIDSIAGAARAELARPVAPAVAG